MEITYSFTVHADEIIYSPEYTKAIFADELYDFFKGYKLSKEWLDENSGEIILNFAINGRIDDYLEDVTRSMETLEDRVNYIGEIVDRLNNLPESVSDNLWEIYEVFGNTFAGLADLLSCSLVEDRLLVYKDIYDFAKDIIRMDKVNFEYGNPDDPTEEVVNMLEEEISSSNYVEYGVYAAAHTLQSGEIAVLYDI